MGSCFEVMGGCFEVMGSWVPTVFHSYLPTEMVVCLRFEESSPVQYEFSSFYTHRETVFLAETVHTDTALTRCAPIGRFLHDFRKVFFFFFFILPLRSTKVVFFTHTRPQPYRPRFTLNSKNRAIHGVDGRCRVCSEISFC